MKTSELVTPQHLQLKAVIYIRQSSPHQMISNQESLKLQYALHQRAIDLGWSNENIEIIDSDLGTTATTTEHRTGFKELIAQVTFPQKSGHSRRVVNRGECSDDAKTTQAIYS